MEPLVRVSSQLEVVQSCHSEEVLFNFFFFKCQAQDRQDKAQLSFLAKGVLKLFELN